MSGCEFLPWDTAFFGHRTGRWVTPTLTAEAASEAVAWAERERIRCLYLLLGTDDPVVHAAAGRAGFERIDDRVTLERPVGPTDAVRVEGVRPFEPGDIAALTALAAEAHTDSRFFADPRFDRAKCRELYRLWIERDCRENPRNVRTAVAGGAAVGYVTCGGAAGGAGQIGLIAVAAAARGRGLGGALVRAALAQFADDQRTACTVVTQGKNADARRLYDRAGFRIARVEYWFHRWTA